MKPYINKLKDIVNGIYSGIPICCILHYLKLYPVPFLNDLKKRHIKFEKTDKGIRILDLSEIEENVEYQYVRCDRCRTKNIKVPIKSNGLLWK